MIPRSTVILSGKALDFKIAKRFHNITCYHGHYLSKILRQKSCTKWTKVNTVWGCGSSFHQTRNIETQNISHIVKSPYKHLEFPNITLLEFLSEKMEKFSKHVAIECGITGRKYTYSQLQKLSRNFAASLLKAGLRPGQVVAVISANCPEYPIIVFGCLEAGLVMTPMNHVYTSDEIHNQLKDSKAVCIVSAVNTLESVSAAVNKINDSTKPEQHIKIICLDINSGKNNTIAPGVGRFSQLTADYIDASDLSSLKNSYIDPSDVVFLPYSSGTTGLAKGVKLSHNNIVNNLLQMGNLEITPFIETTEHHQEILPGILPFYHIYGLTQILCNSIMFGSKIVALPKFEPKVFLDTLKLQKCTILYLVPPLVLFLGSSDKVTNVDVQHVRWIISGAAPLGANDLEKCLNKISTENRIVYAQGYGLTESSPVVTFPHRGNLNLSTVGYPISNTMVKVIDIESGKTLGPNQGGEICVKGPQVMMGYLNNPAATASTIDKEGWFHTGDLGHYDEGKQFYITDRIKELIKVNAFQVPPAELEEVVRTMPGINDVGVIGVPDKKSGEVPIAFIVQSSTNPATASDVKLFVSKKVSPFKQLAHVFIVNAIPKTASGKILRREMLKMYEKLKQNQTV